MSRGLSAAGALLVPASRRDGTCWTDDGRSQGTGISEMRDFFEDGDVDRQVEALTRSWRGREAAGVLQPVLRELLVLGRRFRAETTLEEDVSDTIYAMF